MPVISANTLFHFTPKLEYLIGILENDFIPSFCLEINVLNENENELDFAIPMVSFCDIPLSNITNHIEKYGNYALGMSKEWAKTKGLNPVLYTKKDSKLSNQIWNLYMNIVDDLEGTDSDAFLMISDILCYLKPYEGKFSRDLNNSSYEIFYNEREWRYVPPAENKNELPFKFLDEFHDLVDKKLSEQKLTFSPVDIKYIIVSEEEEIKPMLDSIRKIKGDWSINQVEMLYSRIITVDQIINDF